MTVDWGDYMPWQPPVGGPAHTLSKREARAVFDARMASIAERREELERLLLRNGVVLGPTDEDLDRLDAWFIDNVEPAADGEERLRPLWYAVVSDISLYVGELIIARAPTLRWAFWDTNRRHQSFQREVITGFTKVENPRYNVDIDLLIAALGVRAAHRRNERPGSLVFWVRDAVSKA